MKLTSIILLMIFTSCARSQPIKVATARATGITSAENKSIVSLIGVDSAKFYGNSITLGLNATAPNYDSAYRNRFTDVTGIPNRTLGSVGTGLWYALQSIIVDTTHGLLRSPTIFAAGYNDVRFLGADSALMRKFREVLRHSIALQFMKRSSFKAAGDCDVNSALHWNRNTHTFNRGHTYHLQPAKFMALRTSGSDTSTWIKYDFTGDNFMVAFDVSDSIQNEGFWGDSLLINVDNGAFIDTISTFCYASGNTPRWGWEVVPPTHCYVKTGLGVGSHSVKVQFIANSRPAPNLGLGQPILIDYFATLETDTSQIRPIIMMEIMKQTAAGYLEDPSFDQSNDAAVNACNNVIYQMRDLFWSLGYSNKVTVAPLSAFYDPATGEDTDKIHPKASYLGHGKWAEALLSVVVY
jgi:hypothetical protein